MVRITTHPGEILLAEFMEPLSLSARGLAAALNVPPNRITAIVNGDRSVTADTALRLGRYFGTSGQFWLNLQQARDLSVAQNETDYSGIRREGAGDGLTPQRPRQIAPTRRLDRHSMVRPTGSWCDAPSPNCRRRPGA